MFERLSSWLPALGVSQGGVLGVHVGSHNAGSLVYALDSQGGVLGVHVGSQKAGSLVYALDSQGEVLAVSDPLRFCSPVASFS
mmetsp:Transcript_59092/g.136320  ORF Transcript_59092/g.136320 Transcript_59092/m.136320 type:complete len:83 (-) Transcript_59092:66-314(-)